MTRRWISGLYLLLLLLAAWTLAACADTPHTDDPIRNINSLIIHAPDQAEVPEGLYTIPYTIEDLATYQAELGVVVTVTVTEDGAPVTLEGDRFRVAEGRVYLVTITATDEQGTSKNKTITITGTPPAPLTLWLDVGMQGGSVSGGGEYPVGTSVTAVATPEEGYLFDGWYDMQTGAWVSDDPAYTFALNTDTELWATFALKMYELTLQADPPEAVEHWYGGGQVPHGPVQLAFTSKSGYTFLGWYEGEVRVSEESVYSFVLTSDKTLTAKYTLNHYTLTLQSDIPTAGTLLGGGTVPHGDTTITAQVHQGYTFDGWYEGTTLLSSDPVYSFYLYLDLTLTARFIPDSYEVLIEVFGNGEGIVWSGEGSYLHGEGVTVTTNAQGGCTFDGWYDLDTEEKLSDELTYTFVITGTRMLQARWTPHHYSLTVQADSPVGGSVSGGGTFAYGESVTVIAQISEGYTFDGWYEGETWVSGELAYTFSLVSVRNLTARWTQNLYKLTVYTTSMAGGSLSGGGTYTYGASVTVIAQISEGYTFDGWYDERGEWVSDELAYTFTIFSDRSLAAYWTQNLYELAVQADPAEGGNVSSSGNLHPHGTRVSVTADPLGAYIFDGWYEGEVWVSDELTYTFDLLANRTLIARWTLPHYDLTVQADPVAGGSVEGGGNFAYGTSVSVTATTNPGYTFDGWYEDGVWVSSELTYTFNFFYLRARTLVARWTLNRYELTVLLDVAEGTPWSGSGTYAHGELVTIMALDIWGYTFDGWYEGEVKVSDAETYSFIITGARTLVMRRTQNHYDLTVQAGQSGGGSVSDGGHYAHGESVSVTATTNPGYTFDGWYEDGVQVSDSAVYSFLLTSARTLVAQWTRNHYDLTVQADPVAGGTVSGGGTYAHGTSVTVSAVTTPGYTFDGWYEGQTKVTDALTYTLDLSFARTLIARWTQNHYSLTVQTTPEGTVSGGGTYAYGSAVTVTAEATTPGYLFTGWFEDGVRVSDEAVYTFTLTGARTLTATWTLKQCQLTLQADPTAGGNVSGGGTFPYGYVTVTAQTNEGYTFAGWYEGEQLRSSDLTCELFISNDTTLVARWTQNHYVLTTETDPVAGGSVAGGGSYAHGSSVTVTAMANIGYTFDGWHEDGVRVSDEAVYTFTLTGARTLTATWTLKQCQLTLQADPTAGGGVSGGGTFPYGYVTVTAQTNEGYTFDGWYEGEQLRSSDLTCELFISNDTTLVARWTQNHYVLTTETDPVAGGSVAGGGSYAHGSSVTVTAMANIGYTFDGWHEDGVRVSGSAVYSFILTSARVLTARWTQNHYALTLQADPAIGGRVEGGGTFAYGTSVTIAAHANAGYVFEGWYIGTTRVSENPAYPYTITGAATLTAKWQVYDVPTPDYYFVFTPIEGDAYAIRMASGVTLPQQLYLPKTYQGKPVTTIEAGAFSGTAIKQAYIPDSYTEIGKGAFEGCSALESMVIPFVGNRLNKPYPIYQNEDLFGFIFTPTSIQLGSNTYAPSSLKTVSISGGDSIKTRAFKGCVHLTCVAVPASVTSIQGEAFYGCVSLSTVVLPDSVTTINPYAFQNCTALTGVRLPDNLTYIGDDAFHHCASLLTIHIPSSVTYIGARAFLLCDSLLSITVSESNTAYRSLDGILYNKEGTTLIQCPAGKAGSVFIPDAVKLIGSSAFANCAALTSVVFGEGSGLERIGGSAFISVGLLSIEIPASVTQIGTAAFFACPALTSVTFAPGSQLTDIDSVAFEDCPNLLSIEIPAGVTRIGRSAFAACFGLTNVTFAPGSQLTHIAEQAFLGCASLISMEIPTGVLHIGAAAFGGCARLNGIELPPGLTRIESGIFSNCHALTDIEIPAGVLSIGSGAFNNCVALARVTFGEGSVLTHIEQNAFLWCHRLTELELPATLTQIGEGAFAVLAPLSLTLHAPQPPAIGVSIFGNVAVVIYVPAASLEAYQTDADWSKHADRMIALP